MFRKGMQLLILAALFLSGLVSVQAGWSFERHEIQLDAAGRRTVLTGFLLGADVADVVTLHAGASGERRLSIHSFDGRAWTPAGDATLRREAAFVDLANIAGRDRLIAYGNGRMTWFDPDAGTEHDLLSVNSDYDPPSRGGIPWVDVTRDLNGDGRDDLVVPDGRGFRVFTQTPDGAFDDPVTVGSAPWIEFTYGLAGYRHDPWGQGGVHQADHDRDGRKDLLYWSGGRLAVHHQQADGRFAPEPERFPLEVNLDGGRNSCSRHPAYGFDSVEACYEADHSALTRGDRRERMLQAVTDVNGDGVDDLVVFSLTGRSVFSIRGFYEVHPGAPAPDGGLVFAREPGASAGAEGMPGWMELHDFDGDGQTDVMLTKLNVGFFKAIGGMLSRSTSLDVRFHRMQGGAWADKPNADYRIKLDLSRKEAGQKAVATAPVLIGDVDGDGRQDLLLGKGRGDLRVFFGTAGPELFAREPHKVNVDLPNGREFVRLTDLDGDGKQDVVLHHPDRVTLLISD